MGTEAEIQESDKFSWTHAIEILASRGKLNHNVY
jgi:hypothetical protein